MRTAIIAVMFVGIGLTAAHAQSPPGAPDCRLKQLASLDVAVTRNTLTTPVNLNGVTKTLELRLDNAFNALTEESVKELNLPTKGASNLGVEIRYGRTLVTRIAQVDKLQFGGTSSLNWQFLVAPSSYYITGAAGHFGNAAFSKLDFDLDIGQGKLKLFDPDHCPGQVIYWTLPSAAAKIPLVIDELNSLYSPMTLDGQPVLVKLGQSGPSLMGMNIAHTLFGIRSDSPGLTEVRPEDIGMRPDFANGYKVYSYPFQTLSAGGLSVLHPKIYIYDQPVEALKCRGREEMAQYNWENHPTLQTLGLARCFGGADVLLSLTTMDKLHWYFSRKEKMIYVTAADAK